MEFVNIKQIQQFIYNFSNPFSKPRPSNYITSTKKPFSCSLLARQKNDEHQCNYDSLTCVKGKLLLITIEIGLPRKIMDITIMKKLVCK